ncbi:hypothetical protein [Jatrophihabitans sp.]|uniref:hypothetical protein n=1 Tax=Jatrophihabitans sp. TaxID=1932789 RepID=UPI0030C6A1F0|nr:hypothetical protein [Jatrophihabitans sp.]
MSIPLVAPASTPLLVDRALEGVAHRCVLGNYSAPAAPRGQTVSKDSRTWRIGDSSEVSWIRTNTPPGPAITSAIPPIFDAYATVVIPDDDSARPASDTALIRVLTAHTSDQPWWLGYLDTGAHDVVFDRAWKVICYSGWSYVLVEAGPTQAESWRTDDNWRGRLPDLIFPADHTWLVSMLWDDDWRCLGGSSTLVQAVLAEPALDARAVEIESNATPPGYEAR